VPREEIIIFDILMRENKVLRNVGLWGKKITQVYLSTIVDRQYSVKENFVD
jgi:hypothetical protein